MKLESQRIPGGRLVLDVSQAEAEAVRRFVLSGDALHLPADCRMPLKNPRSAVWNVDLPGVGRCILKEFRVVRDRGLGRRLESAFKLRFVHRGLRTMQLAGRLAAAGIRTFVPFAFWTDSRGGIRNFLLYRYVEGEIIGDRWMGELAAISPPAKADNPLSPEALHSFLEQAGALVRNLHEAGVVHTDLHPKNFVFPDASCAAGPLSVIDLDSAYCPSVHGRRALFTVRMRSLRRLAQCFRDEDDPGLRAFVRAYSRDDPETESAVLRALRFWRGRKWNGALDIVRAWLRCPPPRPFAARGRRRYDLVFSLGYDCKCSQSLRRAGLQHFSYPFDWLIGTTVPERARIVADSFRGWFELADLEDIGPSPFNRFAVVTRIAVNRKSGLEFRHDFPLETPLCEGYPGAAEKYERRTERLLASIEKASSVLAVFSDGFGCPPVSLADLEETRAILARRFGDKIDVLGLFDDAPGISHAAQEAVSADGRTVRWSLPCLKRTPSGVEVRDRVVAHYLADRIECPDPHTPAERRARRRAERLATYGKYKARNWWEMMLNRMLFRRYRRLSKILQRKGLLPANRPGRPYFPA
ncbi:MAG: hypothetical protein IK066_09265 [Kiritimatiellae bacterium]|nr:hypothetical protein [Kiritimatiellia bacterium]